MSTIAKVLTPAGIASADYSTAQEPILGGDVEVYITSKPSKKLGLAQVDSDGVITYTYVATPTAGSPGPIVAVATVSGLRQAAPDPINFCGLTASFAPVAWSSNKTSYDFPIGRATEFTGTYGTPTSSSVPALTLSAGDGMLSGSQFELWELPALTDFKLAGCTSDRQVTVPARGSKNIACGKNEAEWTVPGMIKTGQLEITGMNQGFDDGLMRYIGQKCQVLISEKVEGRVLRMRAILTDFTGDCKAPYPTGENESTVTLTGQFSRFMALLANADLSAPAAPTLEGTYSGGNQLLTITATPAQSDIGGHWKVYYQSGGEWAYQESIPVTAGASELSLTNDYTTFDAIRIVETGNGTTYAGDSAASNELPVIQA